MLRRAPARPWQAALREAPRFWPLWSGGLLLLVLWAGPLPELARISFSSHMLLHLGVMIAAAPLLALGIARLGLLSGEGGIALAVVASGTEMLLVWAWHLPVLHAAAAFNPALFALQQGSFLAAGILVWLPGLAPGRRAAAAGVAALTLSFVHMSMLGVLLATIPRLIYPLGVCGGGFGLDPLTDQRLGGVLMALGAGLPYLAGATAMAYRLLAATPGAQDSPRSPS